MLGILFCRKERMPHFRRALVALVVVVGTIVVAAPAGAVTPPPSLVGEQLFAGPDSTGGQGLVIAAFTCKADQSGEIRFSATGVAVGPYPGTFIETGTVKVGPGTLTGAGPVVTLTSDFEITSGTTLVSGTKTLLVALTNEGACASFADGSSDVFFVSQVSYSATIKLSPTSVFQETGTGAAVGRSAVVGGGYFAATQQPEGAVSLFEESYETSNGVVPLAGTGKVTGGGWILGPNGKDRTTFGFEAQTNPNGLHATCTVIDHATKSQIKCKSVDTLVVTGTHATFTGSATDDGETTHYQIDVDDLGEPGTSDTFRIVLGNGYVASGTLLGGNIQIHS
jgi:hypothetical protein